MGQESAENRQAGNLAKWQKIQQKKRKEVIEISNKKNKDKGMKAENYFMKLLNETGIPHEYKDDWFDILVNEVHKVEVKSCEIAVSDGFNRQKKRHYRIGRFNFKDEYKNNENIWICFIIRHKKEFILHGLCRLNNIGKKKYVTLYDLRSLKTLSFDEWIMKVV